MSGRPDLRLWLGMQTLLVGLIAWSASIPAWRSLFVGAVIGSQVITLLIWQRGGLSLRQVLFFALLFRMMVFWLPPTLSDDAYRYVWDGWLQVAGINPYLYPPEHPALAAFQASPLYAVLNSRAFYSIYPPVSQLVFAIGGFFQGLGWEASYYVIKAMLALSEVGGVLLLARMVTPRLLLLYAFHPLSFLEAAGQAHTEALVMPLLVLTLWLVQQQRGGWASVALAAAGWTKLYPFVLFPLLWRRFGWQAVWPAGICSVLLVAPYVHAAVPANIATSLDLYVRYFEFNAGLYYAVKQLFYVFTEADWSKVLGPAFRGLFLLALPVVYLADAWQRWPLDRAFRWGIGLFFVLATTVHPWYLLGLLPLTILGERVAWPWHWLALLSMGTYLRYVDGPYWAFVVLGWVGFALIGVLQYSDAALQAVQRYRGRAKARRILPFFSRSLAPGQVLDLGAGEGYVGQALHDLMGVEVTLTDVVPMNRTDLPFVLYNGRTLPFDAKTFDYTVLYFVLHHCRDQEQVLKEALRVSRRGVVVVESVYEHLWDKRLLTFLDRLANRLRSGGLMNAQEAYLHFRTYDEWELFFMAHQATIVQDRRRGSLIHRQAFFLLQSESVIAK
jgi:SAM-dependent methyltransferase